MLHFTHVIKGNNSFVSSGSNVDINNVKDIFGSYDFEALHAGLKSTYGIDFSYINSSSTSFERLGASLTDITETANQSLLPWNHNISSSIDSVNNWVFASIDVIKFGFGNRVVNNYSGAQQFVLLFKFIKPGNSSGSFFGNTFQVLREFAEVIFILLEIFINGLVKPVFILR